jgi:hypothetical protein
VASCSLLKYIKQKNDRTIRSLCFMLNLDKVHTFQEKSII